MAQAASARRHEPDDDTVIHWEPQARQAAFIACPADDVGFGGSRGGGKSDAVVGDFINHEDIYGEHAVAMAFRRERTQLIELIERSRQILVPLGFKWHEQDKYFRGPSGGRLRFTYLENDSDADAYQGHSYTRIYPEEMGTFPSEGPINKLQATLRSGHGVPCQMKGTCNPGGPGHQWVKARYKLAGRLGQVIEGEYVFENPFTKKKILKRRAFIPSRVTDNKYLGDDYVANLYQVGSKALVEAWIFGDWDVVEGAFFDCWDVQRHVIRPFAVPAEWTRFRSVDWGSAKPFSVGWWAIASDDTLVQDGRILDHRDGQVSAAMDESDAVGVGRLPVQIPRGAMVRYREWYGSATPNVGLKLHAEEVAGGIISRSLDEKYEKTVLDPSMFIQNGGPSLAERFMKAKLTGLFPGDNSRVSQKGAMGGWDQMRARMVGDADGRPMIFTFSTCVDSIRTIPALQHDADRPEDVDTDGEDHAADEWRYACMSRPYVRTVVPPKPKPRELIYEVNAQGQLVGNMSVLQIVQERMRRKKSDGD
jgi:hypothetical protein